MEQLSLLKFSPHITLMATVVRVKRKADQHPADTIVLAPKVARLCDGEEVNYTFKYAGTFKDPNSEEAGETIRRVKESKKLLRTDPKIHTVDVHTKLREEHRSASKRSRLQLLLEHRAIIEETGSEEISDKDLVCPHETTHDLFRIYDVIAEDIDNDEEAERDGKSAKQISTITCNDVPMVRESAKPPEVKEDFVYDVYFSNSQYCLPPQDDIVMLHYAALEELAPEAAYESDLGLDDDSDSNAEDNWRNDYPDEDADFECNLDYYGDYSDDGGGTDFMGDKLHNLCLDIEDDLSAGD